MARRTRFPLFPVVVILIACGLGWGARMLFGDMTPPSITLTPHQERVAPTLPLTVTAEDADNAVKYIKVTARRNGAVLPVIEQRFSDGAKKQSLTFTLKDVGMHDTAFDLEITAVDGSFAGFGQGNSALVSMPTRIDTTPPRITVKTATPYIRRGGTGCVLYSVSEDVGQTGVKVDNRFFPGFRQENGDYLVFFAFPYQMELKDFQPKIVAVDLAGNARVDNLSVNRINRVFKQDTLDISQGFLDAKAEEFSRIVPGDMPDIDRFLQVNGRVRRENAQTLLEIGKDTAPEILWDGAFLRLPDAAPRAGFGDARTYKWQGRDVDHQTHLGLDLASVAQAPVPASNSGRVVFVGYLGIYGNMVVIDHGLGLQSLYSHLSSYQVEKGQMVKKGDIIAHTGATGMAGGDHLHYGILISGLEVTPIEWLDAHWIKDNVSDRIIAAGGKAPAISAPAPAPTPRQTPARQGGSKPPARRR